MTYVRVTTLSAEGGPSVMPKQMAMVIGAIALFALLIVYGTSR